jgi:hypothetical protein
MSFVKCRGYNLIDITKILLKVALNIITLTFRNYDKIKILLNYLAIMLFKGTMG